MPRKRLLRPRYVVVPLGRLGGKLLGGAIRSLERCEDTSRGRNVAGRSALREDGSYGRRYELLLSL